MARNVHDRYHNNYEDYHDHEFGESHDDAEDKSCQMVDKMGCISLAKRLSTLLLQNCEQVTTEEEPAVTEHDREDIGAHRLAREDHSFIRSPLTCQSELGVFQLQIAEHDRYLTS